MIGKKRRLLFWLGMAINGPLTVWPKCRFLGIFNCFWPTILFSWKGIFMILSYRETKMTPLLCWKLHWPAMLPGASKSEQNKFWPQYYDIWGISKLFVMELQFLSRGHITSISGARTFPFESPQKIFRFRAMGHVPVLIQVFGHFGLFPLRHYKYP